VLDQFADINFIDMHGKGNIVKLVSMSVRGVMLQRHNIKTALIPLLPASYSIPNGEHTTGRANNSQVPQH